MNQLPPVLTGNVNSAHSLTNPTHQTAFNGLTHHVHNVSSHLSYSKLYWNVQHFHRVLDNFCLQLFAIQSITQLNYCFIVHLQDAEGPFRKSGFEGKKEI